MSHDERDVETVAEALHVLAYYPYVDGGHPDHNYWTWHGDGPSEATREEFRAEARAVLDALDLPGRERRAKAEADVTDLVRLAPRFWKQVDVKRADTECWEWQGARLPFGHGRYDSPAGKTAHRYAWALANLTSPPSGMVVRHRCDNPPCCNPSHLELGSQADNVADMVARGRAGWSDAECRKGHPREGNSKVRSDGSLRCAECDRAVNARRRRVRVACPLCASVVGQDNLTRHLRQVHALGATEAAKVRARAAEIDPEEGDHE